MRDFVPWRFSVAGRISAWIGTSCRRPKTCTLHIAHSRPERAGIRSGRAMLRGVKKLGFKFTLMIAGYNLVRLPKLI